ncbi:MAG: hypothetical protein V1728_03750 [Candidatus Micrarchaeota archaeon]
MTMIKKQILVNGNAHYVEINSSLDLEEVEVTGADPISGKTVHISLSSLMKTPKPVDLPPSPSPQPLNTLEMPTQGLEAVKETSDNESVDSTLHNLFR